jgi:DMSO/TMAO reductase YedYZ molybdopterin-dependent catalytic subunit
MSIVSPGFGGKRRHSQPDLPAGQYLTTDFPVLSAGPTPRVALDRWRFTIADELGFWEGAGYHMYGDPWSGQRYHGD